MTHQFLREDQLWFIRQLNGGQLVIRLLDEIEAYKALVKEKEHAEPKG